MNLKDVVMSGGILPAMLKDKMWEKDEAKKAEEEELKKKLAGASQGAAGTQAVAGEQSAGQGMKKGGKVSSASNRADGCCTKGKTRGRYL